MIIMALDHVRDLLHTDAISQQPTDLSTTTPLLFFTRWITYLCAPVFVFLSGTSAFLALQRSDDQKVQRAFLFRRGLYLLVIEFTVVNFGLYFDWGWNILIFEVIAAIGVGFMLLSLLSRLSWKLLGILGLVIIAGHNAMEFPAGGGNGVSALLGPLFRPGAIAAGGHTFIMAYPPLPWLGIMLVGFAAGHCFGWEPPKRRRGWVWAGSVALLLFLVLRMWNVYGDPSPWSVQKNAMYTFLSFMNVTKYPPSLLFTLVTLGIMFYMLAAGDRMKGHLFSIATTYGRVPLFYFLLHFYLIHIILLVVLRAQGIHWEQMEFTTGTFGRPRNIPAGVSLATVYLLWVCVVAVLYKPCQWFGRYKLNSKSTWVRYL